MGKRSIILLSILLTLVLISSSSAQYYMSNMSDARTPDSRQLIVGGGISIISDIMGIGGNLRYGLSDDLEGGFKLGIIKNDKGQADHTGLAFGMDLKYQILNTEYGDGVDFALSGGWEYYNIMKDVTFMLFGTNALISYPVEFNTGQVLSPFFKLNLRAERASANNNSDSEFEFGFGFGTMFDISRSFGFFGEVFIMGGNVIDEGVNLGIWFSPWESH